ncbi:MAG: tryptophanase [bacterium]|nr:tryptophanase [bacterium]
MGVRRQPAEPYRIKAIEPIRLMSRGERLARIQAAKYNLFKIDAVDIYIDLLTDSGTGAMSNAQWAALMMGDESYACAQSYRRFENRVQQLFRKKFAIPVHQGRVAENLMFSSMMKPGQYVINNTHFDTTRANVMHKGGIPIDLPCKEASSNEPIPFKGNMDIVRLEEFIKAKGVQSIAAVMLTVTNNSSGGQPVSMANIHETAEICHRYKLPFYFDAARFAENCYFVKRDEAGYHEKSIREIAHEMFDCCDGALMSAKKDGLANIGGLIAINNEELYNKIAELMVVIEGFPTYGGLAGRDLDVLAVGLEEVLEFDYLDYRIGQVHYFGEKIKDAGMPIIEPTGGHAVFVDAGRLLPNIPVDQFPGQGLAIAFYVEGAVRTVEIGSLMFGGVDSATGKKYSATKELVRMAIPRRVFTNSHLDYVAEVAERIVAQKNQIPGYRITREPALLRHFTCEMEALQSQPAHV